MIWRKILTIFIVRKPSRLWGVATSLLIPNGCLFEIVDVWLQVVLFILVVLLLSLASYLPLANTHVEIRVLSGEIHLLIDHGVLISSNCTRAIIRLFITHLLLDIISITYFLYMIFILLFYNNFYTDKLKIIHQILNRINPEKIHVFQNNY